MIFNESPYFAAREIKAQNSNKKDQQGGRRHSRAGMKLISPGWLNPSCVPRACCCYHIHNKHRVWNSLLKGGSSGSTILQREKKDAWVKLLKKSLHVSLCMAVVPPCPYLQRVAGGKRYLTALFAIAGKGWAPQSCFLPS